IPVNSNLTISIKSLLTSLTSQTTNLQSPISPRSSVSRRSNPPRSNQHRKRRNKPMNQERIEKRTGLPGNETKCRAAENGTHRFQLRLAQVHEGGGHSLQQDGRPRAKVVGQGKKDEAAPHKFPAEQIDAGDVKQVKQPFRRSLFIEPLHGRRARNGPQHDGHPHTANQHPLQTGAPIAEAQAKSGGAFAEDKEA